MIPILYEQGETKFISQGIGSLADAISCTVTEERNGEYELEMTYPASGKLFSELTNGRLILAKPNDTSQTQPFRIYRISTPMSGKVTINAEHISYLLNGIPVAPFTATGMSAALNGLKNNSLVNNPFTCWTDSANGSTKFTVKVPKSFRACLGGTEGSILDTFSGSNPPEFEFDRFAVKVHAQRGADRGVTIEYGKNLTDAKQENSIENTYTGVLAYWSNTDQLIVAKSDIQYASNHSNFANEKIFILDTSQDFPGEPTKTQLNTAAANYVKNNNVGTPKINLMVSFVNLWQSDEYKNTALLERVQLCDTVRVKFSFLGIDASAKVIKTVYNVLKERYDSIGLGESKSSFSDTIRQASGITGSVKAMVESNNSFLQSAIDRSTDLISGGLGGYVVINKNADGQPEEILVMDNADKTKAVNVIRINKNGIGFSKSGYNGPFSTAWTIDGAFNADYITSGIISAVNINGVNISGSNVNGTNINGSNITGSTITTQNSSNSYYKLVMDDGGLTYTDSSDGTESSIEMGKNADLNNQEYSSIAIICSKNSNQSGIVVFPNSILLNTRNILFHIRNVYFESDKITISTGSLELETQSGTSTGLTKTLYVDGSNGKVLTMKFVHGILVDVSEGSLIGG